MYLQNAYLVLCACTKSVYHEILKYPLASCTKSVYHEILKYPLASDTEYYSEHYVLTKTKESDIVICVYPLIPGY